MIIEPDDKFFALKTPDGPQYFDRHSDGKYLVLRRGELYNFYHPEQSRQVDQPLFASPSISQAIQTGVYIEVDKDCKPIATYQPGDKLYCYKHEDGKPRHTAHAGGLGGFINRGELWGVYVFRTGLITHFNTMCNADLIARLKGGNLIEVDKTGAPLQAEFVSEIRAVDTSLNKTYNPVRHERLGDAKDYHLIERLFGDLADFAAVLQKNQGRQFDYKGITVRPDPANKTYEFLRIKFVEGAAPTGISVIKKDKYKEELERRTPFIREYAACFNSVEVTKSGGEKPWPLLASDELYLGKWIKLQLLGPHEAQENRKDGDDSLYYCVKRDNEFYAYFPKTRELKKSPFVASIAEKAIPNGTWVRVKIVNGQPVLYEEESVKASVQGEKFTVPVCPLEPGDILYLNGRDCPRLLGPLRLSEPDSVYYCVKRGEKILLYFPLLNKIERNESPSCAQQYIAEKTWVPVKIVDGQPVRIEEAPCALKPGDQLYLRTTERLLGPIERDDPDGPYYCLKRGDKFCRYHPSVNRVIVEENFYEQDFRKRVEKKIWIPVKIVDGKSVAL